MEKINEIVEYVLDDPKLDEHTARAFGTLYFLICKLQDRIIALEKKMQ